jgi:hypothetical protein
MIFDDTVLQFGESQRLQAMLPLPLTFDVAQGDELELQVTASTSDGSVSLYQGNAQTEKPELLALKVLALASENPALPVRIRAKTAQYTIRCANSTGVVTVIVRQFRGRCACRS